MNPEKLKIRNLRARAVNVPFHRPLRSSGAYFDKAPLVLIDLETEEGITGCGYIFTFSARALKPMVSLFDELAELIQGDPVSPVSLEEKMQRTFRLFGTQGMLGMAIAGIDIAAWDALAKAVALPLVRLLGGTPQPIPAYNSTGLGVSSPSVVGREAEALIASGFKAVKIRLGYPTVQEDIAAVRAVKQAIPEEIMLMSDYNQLLMVGEAIYRIQQLDSEGLYWIEEPIRFDEYAGYAQIRNKTNTPIQLGENCWGTHDMARALATEAADFFMPDVVKIGGVTGWMRAIALAEPVGLPVSSHLFPEVSAHLLAVTPTRHYLEYVDWASPILQEPLQIEDGQAIIPHRAGNGMYWDEEAVAQYLVT